MDRPRRLEGLAAAWTFGWAAINLVSLLANQYLGIPLDGTFYGYAALALAFAGVALLAWRRERWIALARRPFLALGTRLESGIVLVFAGFLVLVLYKALIVFPAHPDELIYHMELPKVAWQTGFLPLQPGLDLVSQGSAYPDLLVTQQLWIYLGGGAFDPNWIRPIVPVDTTLLLLLVFSEARRRFGFLPAGAATAALLSLFSFTSLTFLMMDEVPVALYTFLGVHFALRAHDEGRMPFLAGLALGFAALVKYDALAALVALGLALVVAGRWSDSPGAPGAGPLPWQASARSGLAYFVAAVPPALPILVRNLLRLGNPVYPFFFGGVDNQISPALLATVDVPGVVLEILGSEAVSLLATVLVAAILLGFARRKDWTWTERLLLLFVALYLPPYLAVPLLGSQIRYLAPVLPAMAVFAGRQLTWWLGESPPRPRRAGAAVFLGPLVVTAGVTAWAPFYSAFAREVAAMTVEVFAVSTAVLLLLVGIGARPLKERSRKIVAVGLILVLLVPGVLAVVDEKSEADPLSWSPYLLPASQDAYLTAKLGPDWAMWTWMNANLGANVTVLSFEPRVYYLEARVVNAISPEIMPTYNMTLQEAVAFLRSHGVGYVLDSVFGDSLFLNYLYVDSSPVFQNLSNATYFTVLHREGPDTLYMIAA